MKIHSLLGIVLISLLTLTGCAKHSAGYWQASNQPDLTQETWPQQTNPNRWINNVDPWFLTGHSNIEKQDHNTLPYKALTVMKVRVPNFTRVYVEGDFKVHIVGGQQKNSVAVFGPQAAVRQIIVEVHDQYIYVHQAKDSKVDLCNVLVRIGVNNLRKLTNFGPTTIYGRNITSDGLTVNAHQQSCIYLVGKMELTTVNQMGTGTITIIGAKGPCINVNVNGNGNVNLSGHIGINHLQHFGDGSVNIIGADSNNLSIAASGCGLTSVVGCVNLKQVSACGNSRVYLYTTSSNSIYVSENDNAQVGLAGYARTVNIDLTGNALFAGRRLTGDNVFVKTRSHSHANVSPAHKIFAAALDSSTIYYFGSPGFVSRYTIGRGVILPM